jgi:hypothetical protein
MYIGDSMVSGAIWEKTCTSNFFKDGQKYNLKTYNEWLFSKLDEKTYNYTY